MFCNILHRKTLESFFNYLYFAYHSIHRKKYYTEFSKYTGIDIVTNPDEVFKDLTISLRTAIWFWNKNKLNDYCDKGDFIGLTKRINGGTNGLEDRKKYYEALKKSL